jgi:hypothetical protein
MTPEPTPEQTTRTIDPSPFPTESCAAVTIDFDNVPDGTPLKAGAYIKDQYYYMYGVMLSASGGLGDLPCLFDTSDVGNATGGDTDLGSPNEMCSPSGPGVGAGGAPDKLGEYCVPQENVLIVQKARIDRPEDSEDGGVIIFDFTSQVQRLYEVGLMNIKGNDTTILASYTNGAGTKVPKYINVTGLGANSVQTVPINLENVFRLTLYLSGSGAVTSLGLCLGLELPSPASTGPPRPFRP